MGINYLYHKNYLEAQEKVASAICTEEIEVDGELCHKLTDIIGPCHDRFLPVGHWFKGRLRVDEAASHRGCCGCVVTHRRGEWTRECPMRGKVPHKVREVFSTDFGSEASELSFTQKH